MSDAPLMKVEHIRQEFAVKDGTLRAVDDVTLTIDRGETVGLVGESGCGKSTLARTVLRLIEPTQGTIALEGRDITKVPQRELRAIRHRMQMVFQDPYGSLNPRRRIGAIVGDALDLRGVPKSEQRTQVIAALERVGLGIDHLHRWPHELSGGQRQRVGVARALAASPDLLIADEPVSALDVSVQAQLVNLLVDLQRDLGLAQLFVAHDLSVVRQVADRIAVMYLGRIVESGPTDVVFARARHPYTRALLAAVPIADPSRRGRQREAIRGELPSPIDPPPGCHFHPRCPHATDVCMTEQPALWHYADGGRAACHHPYGVSAADVAAASRDDLASPAAAGMSAPDPSTADLADAGETPAGAQA
ncbi:MAG: ATP-binding cassette domain-containing protein [Solirubrobacteraceae bacterium]|nr:ATP-binding cassette domain-containing protein [Solirubrobacteraceae bacterium]